jgi:heme A synthase
LITVFVSITGAVAALGDTLFPAASLAAGMHQDFAGTSSMLLRLRMVHPVIAVLGAAYVIWVAAKSMTGTHAAATRVLILTTFQVAAGAINIALLAPVWMQLFHLLMADLVWISVVLLAMERAVCHGARVNREPILYKAGENLYAEHNG